MASNLIKGGYIATPNANVTAAQTAAAQASGWTPTTKSGGGGGTIQGGGLLPTEGSSAYKALQAGSGSYKYDATSGVLSPIAMDSLTTPVSPVKMPEPPKPINYSSDLANANLTSGLTVTGQPVTTTVTDTIAPKSNATVVDEYLSGLKNASTTFREQVGQAETDRANALRVKENAVNTLKGQIGSITAQATADQLSVTGQGRGIPEAIIGGQQAQIAKEAAIKALPLQAQLAIAQDDLQAAQAHLDTLYKIQVDDAKAQLDYETAKVNAVYQYATQEQKNRLDQKNRDDQRKYDTIKNNIDTRNDWARLAVTNGQGSLSTRILNVDANSDTFNSDLAKITGSVTPKTTGGGVLSTLPATIQSKVIGIATGFDGKDIVKKYNSTVDSINVVNGIDSKSKNPADHQQIVYAFAKALDPDSAVREGEYATIKKYAQSSLNKYGKEISNAIAGTGFLSEAAIENIKATMNQTYNSRKPQFDNALSETKKVINNIAGSNVADEILVNYAGGVSNTNVTSGQPKVEITPQDNSIWNSIMKSAVAPFSSNKSSTTSPQFNLQSFFK